MMFSSSFQISLTISLRLTAYSELPTPNFVSGGVYSFIKMHQLKLNLQLSMSQLGIDSMLKNLSVLFEKWFVLN